jgi:CheY-like chemotaxis protein
MTAGPPPRILVVEDDPDDALFLKRAFAKAGVSGFHGVLPDGQEAIAYLSGEGKYGDRKVFPLPSHLLLDLKLPKVSGFEVLRWLRSSGGLKELPVAILSSSGESADRENAQALGIDAYFIKPTRSEDLLRLVQEIARLWKLPVLQA